MTSVGYISKVTHIFMMLALVLRMLQKIYSTFGINISQKLQMMLKSLTFGSVKFCTSTTIEVDFYGPSVRGSCVFHNFVSLLIDKSHYSANGANILDPCRVVGTDIK